MKSRSVQVIHALFIFPLLCISLFLPSNVFSQINSLDEKNLEETMRNPWKLDQSVFLQNWLVLGAIPIKEMEEIDKDFLSENGGEASVRPVEGQMMKVSGNEMKWMPAKSKNAVDLQNFYRGGRNENTIAYAYTIINRKNAGRVCLTMGTDDGVKVWVNGKVVHRNLKLRALVLDEDRIDVDLNAGDNHLLLKIQQGAGGWGYAVRMMDNPNQFNTITGNIEFSTTNVNPKEKTLAVFSNSNLDQTIFKQTVLMQVCAAGGNIVAKKVFSPSEPVILNFQKWPDGIYEFRFMYKDIRGTEFFKYVTWYKGDILAEARMIVDTAPGKDVITPDASLHRMLADMINDRLSFKLQNPDSSKLSMIHPPLLEFAEFKAKKQIRPNGFVRMTYIDDIDNTPQFCRCYLPLNYNPLKKYPMVVFLHGYDDYPRYINIWSAQKRHESASDKYNVIYIEPHGRWNTSYTGLGERDVLKCIEMAKQKFNVDEERVYLTGASMGGFGTWNVATRHPELFAAIAPIYGGGDYHVFTPRENLAKMSSREIFQNDKTSSTAQLESLLKMPMFVSHGDQDQSVNVNLSRYLVRMLQRWNYDVRYVEVPDKGHSDLGLSDQIVSWMLKYKRNAFPSQVRVRAADLQTASAYWVKVNQKKNPNEFMTVDAEVMEGNVIRVDSKNVLELALTLDKTLVDFAKPIQVFWNGIKTTAKNPSSQKIVLTDETYNPQSKIIKTPLAAGPISDIQNTPFLVVIGTISTDTAMNEIIQQKVELVVQGWNGFQKCNPRVKNDTEVTETDMKQYSLFLIGGPEENAVAKKVFEKVPFQVKSGEIIIDGKMFNAKNALLQSIYQNPYNSDRYISIVAGTSKAGLLLFDPSQQELYQYDYFIADGKIPNFSAGAKDDKILIASGFFNEYWKLSDAFMNTGDEELRSKCAYITANNDLSTNIISVAKPSLALLKSYCGTYQIQGGPLLRIFVADSILKVAQGLNDQFTAVMYATSENEFYVKEANVFLYFVKDEASHGYIMNGRQNGREFTSKKVQ
jgi:pimeloyl-ACP methyl ester carboxylesterase